MLVYLQFTRVEVKITNLLVEYNILLTATDHFESFSIFSDSTPANLRLYALACYFRAPLMEAMKMWFIHSHSRQK